MAALVFYTFKYILKILLKSARLYLQGAIKISGIKITEEEAKRLIEMAKHSLALKANFPHIGKTEEFSVIGDSKKDVFTINIFRGSINKYKYNMGARIKINGIMLLELHINPSNVHTNPDGEKIIGSHWHIYTEKYGRGFAFPAANIDNKNFVKNTIDFLIRFNVIDKPEVCYQEDVF